MKKSFKTAIVMAAAVLCFGITSAAASGVTDAVTSAVKYTDGGNTSNYASLLKLTEGKTTQYFTDEEVPYDDIKTILSAGINAESGMNSQKWHFSAVTPGALLDEIVEEMSAGRPEGMVLTGHQKAQMGDAPLNIVISCPEGSEFDAGLAAQNMAAAAQLLGYGVKIVSSPTIVLNGDRIDYYREQLGIPADMQAEAVLLVGNAEDTSGWEADTYTGASERNPFAEMTTIVGE